MWGYDIEYNGKKTADYDMYVMQRPNIPSPELNAQEIEVPGKGNVYIRDGTVSDIDIQVGINFSVSPDIWFAKWREAKKWLLHFESIGKLKFTDDAEFFYRVKKVTIDTAEREAYKIGKFTVTFTCEGYMYLESGSKEYSISSVLKNDYEECHPVFVLTGSSNTTININGKKFIVNVGQSCIIDTDRMLTYRQSGELMNTYVTGDYEDLYLKPGTNSISTIGASVKVIPNWRCL